jgi:hypothetical protein
MRPKETSVESRDFSSESSPTEKSISRKKKSTKSATKIHEKYISERKNLQLGVM